MRPSSVTCTKQHNSVQFSSRWYLRPWKSPHALHPISQKFPQCCLRNSSDWRWPSLVLSRKINELFLFPCLSHPGDRRWSNNATGWTKLRILTVKYFSFRTTPNTGCCKTMCYKLLNSHTHLPKPQGDADQTSHRDQSQTAIQPLLQTWWLAFHASITLAVDWVLNMKNQSFTPVVLGVYLPPQELRGSDRVVWNAALCLNSGIQWAQRTDRSMGSWGSVESKTCTWSKIHTLIVERYLLLREYTTNVNLSWGNMHAVTYFMFWRDPR